jgi:hypothetical protein
LAGELVNTLVNDQNEGMLVWNIQDHSLAPGIYLVALWAQTPWGQVERRMVKIVLLK